MKIELEKARDLRARLAGGGTALGVQSALIDPVVMEIYGAAGFDWIVIDTEHAAHTPLSVRAMLQAAAHTPAVPVVRLLRLNEAEIGRMLDLGAAGILCPFINTPADAAAMVAACRYPPEGRRSWGPRRAAGFGLEGTDHGRLTHDAVICIALIETAEGVENIEAIAATDGITGVMLGPLDLSIDLGVQQQFDSEPFVTAVAKVRDACRAARVPVGMGCGSVEQVPEFVAPDDRLLLIGGDDVALASDARRTVDAIKPRTAPGS
jgi:4-hydroxy-2-oxoheptanedioate aldolase